MDQKELLNQLLDISETNPFPEMFGDGTMLTGMTPNDIYQLGYAEAFKKCFEAVKTAILNSEEPPHPPVDNFGD